MWQKRDCLPSVSGEMLGRRGRKVSEKDRFKTRFLVKMGLKSFKGHKKSTQNVFDPKRPPHIRTSASPPTFPSSFKAQRPLK